MLINLKNHPTNTRPYINLAENKRKNLLKYKTLLLSQVKKGFVEASCEVSSSYYDLFLSYLKSSLSIREMILRYIYVDQINVNTLKSHLIKTSYSTDLELAHKAREVYDTIRLMEKDNYILNRKL
jgi:hypothetical protein